MNKLQQPLNLQQERCESQLSQERNYQVYKHLCELQHSLMKYLSLNYQRRMKSQAASYIQEQKIETWKRLNWENPGEAEYETVREIVKQQKELLQQDFEQGRDTSVNQLLLDLLRSLRKYFLHNSTREALRSNFTGVDHHREWREFDPAIPDQALPLLSANLQQSNVHERGATFKQHVKIVLQYLKQSTPGWRVQYSQSTRYNEDQEFGILNAHPVL